MIITACGKLFNLPSKSIYDVGLKCGTIYFV
jgi:hypothetical protein